MACVKSTIKVSEKGSKNKLGIQGFIKCSGQKHVPARQQENGDPCEQLHAEVSCHHGL